MRKNYSLRLLLLLFFVAFNFGFAIADTCLVIEMKSGATHSFVLEEQPTITFEGTKLCIVAPSAETRLNITDVERFHFEEATDAVIMPAKVGSTFRYINGMLTVMGSEGPVSVVDAAGRLVYSASGNEVSVDMNAQPDGVYIVNMGKRSVKIKK